MIKLGTISRRKGLLSLMDVKTNSPFLKRVCTLIADAADEEDERDDEDQARHERRVADEVENTLM